MGTSSAQRRLASSTEGASRLQVLQPGAQNHSAKGPESSRAASRAPPPTRLSVSVVAGAEVATVLAPESALHALAPSSAAIATPANTRRITVRVALVRLRRLSEP